MRNSVFAMAFFLRCLAARPRRCARFRQTDRPSGEAKVIGASSSRRATSSTAISWPRWRRKPQQGFALRVQYAEFQSPKQINQIETFVQQGVDALIVAPCDSAGIAPTINDAAAKGIPVFTADIAAHNANVVSHIASDNVLGGKLIGE